MLKGLKARDAAQVFIGESGLALLEQLSGFNTIYAGDYYPFPSK